LVRWQRLVFPGKLCGKSEIKKIKKKKKRHWKKMGLTEVDGFGWTAPDGGGGS
jgi:hypothetical protein